MKTLKDPDSLFELLDASPASELLPTLIVLDLTLPLIGGETTLMLLKKDKRYRHIPVVVYSAVMNERKEKELLSLGAHFCRKKPITIDTMHWLMVELIEFTKTALDTNEKKQNVINY